jgi:threonine/homoserine/homoserine lactone efflux protein
MSLTAILTILTAAAVTPGPNNLIMLRLGRENGLRAALAPATGVVLGGLAMLLASYAGIAALFGAHPALQLALRLGGALFLAALSVKLMRGSTPAAGSELMPLRAPALAGIRSALALLLFQFVNPKAWVLVLTVSAAALTGQHAGRSLALLVASFIVVPYTCLALWAAGGRLASALLRDPRARLALDRTSGLVLAASALWLAVAQ